MAMTTTPPVTVVSSGMSSLSSVTTDPYLMGLPTMLGQHDVVLPPPMTPRCSGGVLCHTSVPQQQPPSSMPLQACANYAMGSPQVGFFCRVEPHCFVYYMFGVCSGVCILLSGAMLDAMFTPGGQPLGFAPLQPLGVYPWQAYGQPGDGHWPTPGMHRMAAPSTTLSRGSLMLLSLVFPSFPMYMVGHTALGAWQRVTWSLCLPYMVGRGLLFQVWFHLMTQLTLHLQWMLNLVILVWWLGIRLMSLLASGLQSSLWLIPTFILGSLVRCYPGTRLWGLFFSGLSCGWLWTRLGFHPHQFPWDTRIGCFLGWAWCHFLSFHSTWFRGRHYTSVWSVWITSQGSWHFGQCCLQMSWQLNLYFTACV